MLWRSFFVAILFWSASALGAQSTQVVRLSIDGMTCPLCVAAVNKALRTTEGVVSAKTHLGQEQAEVEIQDTLSEQVLIEAVAQAGYQATVLSDESIEE